MCPNQFARTLTNPSKPQWTFRGPRWILKGLDLMSIWEQPLPKNLVTLN